jgi:hypothetical protein
MTTAMPEGLRALSEESAFCAMNVEFLRICTDRQLKPVPRFAGYRSRLSDAVDRISDDRAWLASPRCDSYHTVWMQLHEDLLIAVGVNRADEPQPE